MIKFEIMDIRKYFKPVQNQDSSIQQPKLYRLDEESWIEQGCIPTDITDVHTFNTLWYLHPDEYGEVYYNGKVIKTPRWQQNYLRDYNFSGMNHKAKPLPIEFVPYLEWANQFNGNVTFNQVLINWYANGHHYINPHTDNEKQLVKHSPVLSLSLGQERTFRIRNKLDNKSILDLQMPDKTYLMMCGKMQEHYLHEVVKVNGKKGENMGKRINITFRVLK